MPGQRRGYLPQSLQFSHCRSLVARMRCFKWFEGGYHAHLSTYLLYMIVVYTYIYMSFFVSDFLIVVNMCYRDTL